jgi:hypothetical protein
MAFIALSLPVGGGGAEKCFRPLDKDAQPQPLIFEFCRSFGHDSRWN